MMSFELTKQRREELLRKAELRRRAKVLRAAHNWMLAEDRLWYGR
jgi:hypothetical protein